MGHSAHDEVSHDSAVRRKSFLDKQHIKHRKLCVCAHARAPVSVCVSVCMHVSVSVSVCERVGKKELFVFNLQSINVDSHGRCRSV